MRRIHIALMGAVLLGTGLVLAAQGTDSAGASTLTPAAGEVSVPAEISDEVLVSMPAEVSVGEAGDMTLALQQDEDDEDFEDERRGDGDDDDDWRDDRGRRGSWVCFARFTRCRDRDYDRDRDRDRDWDDDDDSRDRDERRCVSRVYSAVAARQRRAIRRALRKCVRNHPRYGDRCRIVDCYRVGDRDRDHDRDRD